MVRCKKGIIFPNSESKVIAAFFIIGTRDKRNMLLRSHTFISQITTEPDFEARWMEAKDERDLQNIILLGKRIRD